MVGLHTRSHYQRHLESAAERYKMYKMCVEQPFGFIYINLMEQRKEDMFMFKFEAKLVPSGAQEASMADMGGALGRALARPQLA